MAVEELSVENRLYSLFSPLELDAHSKPYTKKASP
jgi:hypothetical protein